MHIDRRQFVQGALAASCALAAPVRAEGPKASRVYIGDMHSHLFFFGMGASPEKSRSVRRWRPATPRSSPGRWSATCRGCASPRKGIKQKGSPKPGEAGRVVRGRPRPHQGAHRRAEPENGADAGGRRQGARRRAARGADGRGRDASSRTASRRWRTPTSRACAACSSCTTSRTRSATSRPRRRSTTA